MANTVNVNQNNNTVTLDGQNRGITVTDNKTNNVVNISQPLTRVVTVSTPGPRGPQGFQGIQGIEGSAPRVPEGTVYWENLENVPNLVDFTGDIVPNQLAVFADTFTGALPTNLPFSLPLEPEGDGIPTVHGLTGLTYDGNLFYVQGDISSSKGIRVGTSTITLGVDSKSDAALAIPYGSRIYTVESDGNHLRNLISKTTQRGNRVIQIGQNTIFIDEINLHPGANGSTVFRSGSQNIEIAKVDPVGNISTTSGSFRVNNYSQGLQFYNGTNYTDNRITLSSADNMQFRARNVFQFYKSVEILNGTNLTLKNEGNSARINIHNAGFGSISSSRIDFQNYNTGQTNVLMSITSSGNVGIGTTTPQQKLVVKDGNATITGSSTHQLEISTTNPNGKARLRLNAFREGTNAQTGLPRAMGASNLYKSGAITFFDTDEDLRIRPNSRLAFNIGGSGDIRFVSSTIYESGTPQVETTYFIGDASSESIGIGVGAGTPGAKLHVKGGTTWLEGSGADDFVSLQLGRKSDANGPLVEVYTDDVSDDKLEFHTARFLSNTKFTHTSESSGTDRIDSVNIKGSYVNGGSIEIYGKGGIGGAKTTIGTAITTSGDLKFVGSTTIRNTNGTDDLTIDPQRNLNLGTTSTDNITLGRTGGWPGIIKFHTNTGNSMAITGSKVGIGTTTPEYTLDITGSLTEGIQDGVVRFESPGGGDLVFNEGAGGSNETAIQFGFNGRISGEGGKFNFSSDRKDFTFNTGSGIKNITTPALIISGTGEIKLDYDNMPTTDPNEKGVIYRSSSNGMNNLLFISAG